MRFGDSAFYMQLRENFYCSNNENLHAMLYEMVRRKVSRLFSGYSPSIREEIVQEAAFRLLTRAIHFFLSHSEEELRMKLAQKCGKDPKALEEPDYVRMRESWFSTVIRYTGNNFLRKNHRLSLEISTANKVDYLATSVEASPYKTCLSSLDAKIDRKHAPIDFLMDKTPDAQFIMEQRLKLNNLLDEILNMQCRLQTKLIFIYSIFYHEYEMEHNFGKDKTSQLTAEKVSGMTLEELWKEIERFYQRLSLHTTHLSAVCAEAEDHLQDKVELDARDVTLIGARIRKKLRLKHLDDPESI